MNKQQQVIALDLDDVLAAHAEGFVAWSNKKYGTSLTVEDYDEHWAELWRLDHNEVEQRAKEFYSSGIAANYRHFEEAIPVLDLLRQKYSLVITTSRRKELHDTTHEWLKAHFPETFASVHFAGIWDSITDNSIQMTKARLCKEIGASYLIDDQLKHCFAAAEVGVSALLFGDYTWNQAEQLPENVTRVRDWQEIAEYFDV